MAQEADKRTLLPIPSVEGWGGVRVHKSSEPLPDDLGDAFEEAYFESPLAYGGQYERANPARKLTSYLRELREARPGGRLLDVGCAFGRLLEVARPYYACEGLDTSAYALQQARKRLPDVPLYHGQIEKFVTATRYDIVTCFDVLEHVPAIDLALRRLRDLLAPGGVLLTAMPVYDGVMGAAVGVIDRDPTHLHRWSRRAWLERLQVNGLRVVRMKGIARIPLPGYFLHVISERARSWAAVILLSSERADGGRAQ